MAETQEHLDSKGVENTGRNTKGGIANLKPPWKPGQSGNPRGRRKGQKDYATLYKEALLKIAKANNMTAEEVEIEMVSTGLLKARNGNFFFYKDVMDRVHGKANQPITGSLTLTYEEMSDEQLDQAIADKRRKAGIIGAA